LRYPIRWCASERYGKRRFDLFTKMFKEHLHRGIDALSTAKRRASPLSPGDARAAANHGRSHSGDFVPQRRAADGFPVQFDHPALVGLGHLPIVTRVPIVTRDLRTRPQPPLAMNAG